MKVLFLTRFGRQGASSRMRLFQYLPYFDNAGIEYLIAPLIDDDSLLKKYRNGNYGVITLIKAYTRRFRTLFCVDQFDLLWIEKEALPWFPFWIEYLLLRKIPYILDFDDAIFHSYDLHPRQFIRRIFSRRIDRLMKGAKLVVAGNSYLAHRARIAKTSHVEILPTVVDINRYSIWSEKYTDSTPRLVWIGSPSTIHYLLDLVEPLQLLRKKFPYILRVIGGGPISISGVDVEVIDWSVETEAVNIAQCDVGIMPLHNSPWEQGKCAYKLIQYMACGLPTVASPIGANLDVVLDGVTGFFADSTAAWLEKLGKLLGDESLRQDLGHAGRIRVETDYSLNSAGPMLTALLTDFDRH